MSHTGTFQSQYPHHYIQKENKKLLHGFYYKLQAYIYIAAMKLNTNPIHQNKSAKLVKIKISNVSLKKNVKHEGQIQ